MNSPRYRCCRYRGSRRSLHSWRPLSHAPEQRRWDPQSGLGFVRRCLEREVLWGAVEGSSRQDKRRSIGRGVTAWNLQASLAEGFFLKATACVQPQPCYNPARLEKRYAYCQGEKRAASHRKLSYP